VYVVGGVVGVVGGAAAEATGTGETLGEGFLR